MSSVEISATSVEPVKLLWIQDGAPVTGGAPTMRVRRSSDAFATVLDWDAELFTSDAAALQAWLTMDPVDATYAPGLYFRIFDPTFPSNAVAPDTYAITFYADNTLSTPLGTTEIRVGTVTTINAILADTDNLQTRIPAALVGGRIDASVGAMAADVLTAAAVATGAIDADALSADAGTEIGTAVWATAARTVTAFTGAPLASVVGGVWGEAVPGAYGAGTAGEVLGSGGGGAVSIAAGGITAASFAAGAIDAAAIAAGAIGASEAPLLANLDAAVSSRASAANLTTAQADITTLVTRVDVASSTLATAAALASVATDTTKTRRALWNRRTLSSLGLFTLYADDAVTPLATATVTDVTGGAITVAAGDAARTTALV